MTTERIKEIQNKTAYPKSVSVQQALLKVWNECEQERLQLHGVSQQRELLLDFLSRINGTLIAHPHLQMNTDFVDEYIKANNCG